MSGVDPTEPPSTVPDGVAGRARSGVGPGATIGRFAVRAKLGEGGMGVVYAAHDAQLDRPVAIKLVRVDDGGVQAHARLLREAQAMAKVAHPNVVPIYEVGEHAAQVYIAMELVDGEPLAHWQRRAPRTWQDVLAMYIPTGRGLAAAHAQGIIHRDFKPDNVLVGRDGRPRVLDFGLARSIAARDEPSIGGGGVLGVELTAAGSIMGTPTYMSPEHFRADGIGPASDQFAFAVAVYRALFGQAPFAGETFAELRATVCAGELRPPPAGHDVPPPVVAAVLRALAVRADDRFASIDELLAELEKPLQVDPNRDPARGQRARRVAAVLLCIGALASLIGSSAVAELDASPRWLFLQSSVVMAVLAVAGIGFRKRLVTSAHNRRVGLVMLVTGGGFLVHRAVAWSLGAPALDTLVGDAVLLGVVTVIAGIVIEPWMAYGGPLALGYLALAIGVPSYAGPGFSALVLVYAAAAAWRWGR